VTVAIIETAKNLSETVAVRGENVKGRDHAVSLVAVIVQQEDVVPGSYQVAKISAQLSLDHYLINFLSSAH
jgi:hypothetical protein